MAATRLITMHQNRGRTIGQCLKDRTDYAKNGEKTEQEKYVSTYMCNADIVDKEFAASKDEYLRRTGRKVKGDIIAYQIRQSFKPGEVTPEEANRIGYETAMRFTKGKHAFIVCTHTDRPHVHNHIIFNSTTLDCTRKFHDGWFIGMALCRLSDQICLEHGLSVIVPKKFSERDRSKGYHSVTFRDLLREKIDGVLGSSPESFDEFLSALGDEGYEIKSGKHTAVRGQGQKRFIRFDSLGEGYTESELRSRFDNDSATREQTIDRPRPKKREFDMLIDIQEKLRQGKDQGYAVWAKRHNTKQIAATILFLQQNDVRDYRTLEEKSSVSSMKFHELSDAIKEKEQRLQEIAELKKAIIDYVKTRDVYMSYRKSGYSKKFYERHRAEIKLHKAAKEVFNKQGGKKIPKVRELSEEYGRVLSEKRKLYEEYKLAKKEMMDYQIAKRNVDQVLGLDEDMNRNHTRTTEDRSR